MEEREGTILADRLAGLSEDIDEAYDKIDAVFMTDKELEQMVIDQGQIITDRLLEQAAAGVFAVLVETSRETPIQVHVDKLKYDAIQAYERVRLAKEVLASLREAASE